MEPGDDAEFDLGALRREVRRENAPLSESAAHVDAIIKEWERTKEILKPDALRWARKIA